MIDTTTKALYNDLEAFSEQTFAELGVALDERDPHVACLLQGFADIANTFKQELMQAQFAQKIALLNTMLPSLLLDVPSLALLQVNAVRQLQVISVGATFQAEQTDESAKLKSMRACQLLPITHYQLVQQNETVNLQIQFSEIVDLNEITFFINESHQSAELFLSLLHESLETITASSSEDGFNSSEKLSLSLCMSVEDDELINLNTFYACPQQFLCFKLQWLKDKKFQANEITIDFKFASMCNCLIDSDLLKFNIIPVRYSHSVAADPIVLQKDVQTYPLHIQTQALRLYQPFAFKLIKNNQQQEISCHVLRNEKGFFVQVDSDDYNTGDLLSWNAEVFSIKPSLQAAWRQAVFSANEWQLSAKLLYRPSPAHILKREHIHRMTNVLAFLQGDNLNAKNIQQLLQCCSWVKPAAYYLKYLVKLKKQDVMRQIQGRLLPTQVWQLHFANYGEKKWHALQFFGFLQAFIHACRPLNMTTLLESVFYDD